MAEFGVLHSIISLVVQRVAGCYWSYSRGVVERSMKGGDVGLTVVPTAAVGRAWLWTHGASTGADGSCQCWASGILDWQGKGPFCSGMCILFWHCLQDVRVCTHSMAGFLWCRVS